MDKPSRLAARRRCGRCGAPTGHTDAGRHVSAEECVDVLRRRLLVIERRLHLDRPYCSTCWWTHAEVDGVGQPTGHDPEQCPHGHGPYTEPADPRT